MGGVRSCEPLRLPDSVGIDLTVVLLTAIGLAIGAVEWIDSYQRTTTAQIAFPEELAITFRKNSCR
jgi:hypothetical protein